MKTIDSYDTLLHYLLKLGFAGSPESSIQHRQDMLCCAADAIEAAAGFPEPFSIRCKLYIAPAHSLVKGHWHTTADARFPWLSTFIIKRNDGSRAELNMLSVKLEDWMRKQGRQ